MIAYNCQIFTDELNTLIAIIIIGIVGNIALVDESLAFVLGDGRRESTTPRCGYAFAFARCLATQTNRRSPVDGIRRTLGNDAVFHGQFLD